MSELTYTPRTEEEIIPIMNGEFVSADFARKLEEEITQLNIQIGMLNGRIERLLLQREEGSPYRFCEGD
jgi:hypothetical protein